MKKQLHIAIHCILAVAIIGIIVTCLLAISLILTGLSLELTAISIINLKAYLPFVDTFILSPYLNLII